MTFVVKKRDLTDPAQLQALIVEHADDLERGLTILDTRLLLGQATIDVVGLDADGALVLIAVGLVADEEMFLKAVDAYSWCLEYPDAIRRLYPAVRFSTAQPPRVMFVVERMPEAFHRKIKQLGFHEVDCVEFRHLDVDGTAAVYFDTLARLRRSAAPTAPTPDQGAAPAPPATNGRSTSLKLQKLLGADRPADARAPAPIVRVVHRASPRPEAKAVPSTRRTERPAAPEQPGVGEHVSPRRAADEPVVVATSPSAAVEAPTLPLVGAAEMAVTGVPEILAQGLDTAEGMVEPFATVEPTQNGHAEPLAPSFPESEPVIRGLELVRDPEPELQSEFTIGQREPVIAEPQDADDVPVEVVRDILAAELFTSAEPVAPEPLALEEAPAPALLASTPEPEEETAVAANSAPDPELVVPVLELEPRSIAGAPEVEVPVIAAPEPTEPEPLVAALSIESAEPVVPVVTPAATPSVFSRRPAEAAAARDAKVSFAGVAKDLLPQNHRAPDTGPPVSAPRASVEEITRAALDDLVGATEKRTDERAASVAKPAGPFAKAPSVKRPRTIAPPTSDGQPIAGGPKLGGTPKRAGGAEAAAPAADGETPQAVPEGFEGLQFPNDGVLTRQWMEFLNQMAAGK